MSAVCFTDDTFHISIKGKLIMNTIGYITKKSSYEDILIEFARERKQFLDLRYEKESLKCNEYFPISEFGDYPKTEKEIINILGAQWKHNLSSIGTFFDIYKYSTKNYLEESNDKDVLDSSKKVTLSDASFDNLDDIEDYNGEENDDICTNCANEVSSTPPPNNMIYPSHLPIPSSPTLSPLSDISEEHISDNLKSTRIILKSHLPPSASVLYISTHNQRLLDIYGSAKAVSRLLKKLMDIKGLVMVNSEYHFCNDATNRNQSYPRTYAYNKAVEKLVLGMMKKYHIPFLRSAIDIKPLPTIQKAVTCKDTLDKVKVSSHLSPFKLALSDSDCEGILWDKYGGLVNPRTKKINEMNQSLPDEEAIRARWRIKRGAKGIISKISIRVTSTLCSMRKDSQNESYSEMRFDDEMAGFDKGQITRKKYLDNLFGEGNWAAHDIRGSIYQITHLLNKGVWLGNANDPYKTMFGHEFRGDEREIYKSITMPLYFNRTGNETFNQCKKMTVLIQKMVGKDRITDAINVGIDQMVKSIGKSLGSEIFLHESLLYIDVVYELFKMGIRTAQVYDCFFYEKGSISKSKIEKIIRQCATNYYADYKIWMGGRPSSKAPIDEA